MDRNCKRLLIVDDEADIRFSLQQILEFEGYEVNLAANGKEGLDLLQTIPQPCLILLDLMMPVMNGWQFAEALQNDSSRSKIPIAVVSAFGDKAGSIQSVGVFKKPFEFDSLLEVIQAHCKGQGVSA